MILSDDEIQERIESPLNLLNRLRTTVDRHPRPAAGHSIQHPSLPPSSSDIIPDLEDKIKNSSTRSKATGIMHAAMDELKARMPEVSKPEKLAQIATEMSKVLANQEANGGKGGVTSQIIIYAPQVQSLDNFDIIDVTE